MKSDADAVKTATVLAAQVASDTNVIIVTSSIPLTGRVASGLKETFKG